jgi:hypothetical protein
MGSGDPYVQSADKSTCGAMRGPKPSASAGTPLRAFWGWLNTDLLHTGLRARNNTGGVDREQNGG